ncbi:MAG: hypothetical protein WAW80_01265 [Candidatus Saccharimonadales bacterium]
MTILVRDILTHMEQMGDQQIQQENNQSTNINAQQLTKELVEIFKLRATSLFINTIVLYWPIIALIVLYSLNAFTDKLPEIYHTVEPLIYILLIGIFIFYSLPRIGLDRVEKRFWIKHYLSTKQIVSQEESSTFIHENKSRILSYKRFIFMKTYFIPLIITLVPILISSSYIALNIATNMGGELFAYVFLGTLAGAPIIIVLLLLYWLHTRTILMYAWERFIDAIENGEDLSNEQILQDSKRLVKNMNLRGRSKFMSYDFTTSFAVGLPAVPVTQIARLAPKPVERAVSAYALLYTFNAYQLENLAITYCFYIEAKAKNS